MGGITFNEDDSHFLDSRGRAGKADDPDEMRRWADQYAGTQVKEMFLNVNGSRSNVDSAVRETLWNGYDPAGGDDQPLFAGVPPAERRATRLWVEAAWKIYDKQIDMYGIWIDRFREHGISPWISVRMNDNHFTHMPEHFFHSRFWRDNPDNRRIPYKFAERRDRALDFGREDTREYCYRYIQELVERYDMDGLELDWMRFGLHFRPGHEADGARRLTEFTGKVRGLLNEWSVRRGHPIRLAARVPASPQAALGLGLDALAWADGRLIDMLIVAPFWETVDNDMPVELWRGLLDGKGVTLAAGLELLIRAYPESPLRQYNSLETVRGTAASLLHRGADRIYLFNYFDSDTAFAKLEDYPALLREAGEPATLTGKRRRHVLTYADTQPVGAARCSRLPTVCEAGQYEAFRIHIGPAPESGQLRLSFGIRADPLPAAVDFQVRLNGELCAFGGIGQQDLPLPEEPLYHFEAPLSAAVPGYNVIDLYAAKDVTVTWVEIESAPFRR